MKKHIQVAAALIFQEGKVFATKRGVSPYSYVAHKYEFPGGKIEQGESEQDAVKRELQEELDYVSVSCVKIVKSCIYKGVDHATDLGMIHLVPLHRQTHTSKAKITLYVFKHKMSSLNSTYFV